MKKVDKLGIIVIPLELRRRYGLTEGMKISNVTEFYKTRSYKKGLSHLTRPKKSEIK